MENKEKIISIIVPVYNTEEYLFECIDSIFNQTISNIEVVVIDDGSEDGSLQKLQEIRSRYPDLVVMTQKNVGLGATRNVGIKKSTGKYIFFMDSDDTIEPDMLEKAVSLLEKTGCDFVGFQADIFGDICDRDEMQYMFVDKYLAHLREYNGIDFQKKYHWIMPLYNIPFCIYRRSFIEDNGLYFMEGVLHEDTEFYWHLMLYNPRFVVSREVMYHRRYRNDSIMTGSDNEFRFKSKLQVYKKIYEEATGEIKDIYLYFAINGITKTIREAYDSKLRIEFDDEGYIKDFLDASLEDISILPILHLILLLSAVDVLKIIGYRYEKEYIINNELRNKIREDQFLSKIYDENSKVAVYGTGAFSRFILEMIKKTVGSFKATLTYLDSFSKKGEKKFRGNDVYNYQEVDIASFDLIIIISELYEEEISRTLEGLGIDDKVIGIRRYISL